MNKEKRNRLILLSLPLIIWVLLNIESNKFENETLTSQDTLSLDNEILESCAGEILEILSILPMEVSNLSERFLLHQENLHTLYEEKIITYKEYEEHVRTLKILMIGAFHSQLQGNNLAAELLMKYINGNSDDMELAGDTIGIDSLLFRQSSIFSNTEVVPKLQIILHTLNTSATDLTKLSISDQFYINLFEGSYIFQQPIHIGDFSNRNYFLSDNPTEDLLNSLKNRESKAILLTFRGGSDGELGYALGSVEYQAFFQLEGDTYPLKKLFIKDRYDFQTLQEQGKKDDDLGKRININLTPFQYALLNSIGLDVGESTTLVIYDYQIKLLANTLTLADGRKRGFNICSQINLETAGLENLTFNQQFFDELITMTDKIFVIQDKRNRDNSTKKDFAE